MAFGNAEKIEKMKTPRRDFRNGALLALLCILAYLPSIAALISGDWPIVDDGISLFNIWHELANRGLQNGVVPLWNPYLFCGLPLFANNQSAVLYAPNMIYLIAPIPLALLLDAIFHNILLALGAYVLGRSLNLSRSASFLVAVAFSLAGGVAAHIYNGHMTWHAVRAYLPWELAFLLLYLRRQEKRFVVLLAVSFALQVAAGYPPLVLVSAALCVGMLGAWLLTYRRLPQGWTGAMCLFVLLAGLLSSIYLLPLAEMSRYSVHGDALDLRFATALSGSWKTLVRLLLPGFFGNNGDVQWSLPYAPHEEVGYIGLLPLLLAVAAPWLAHRAKNRRAIWLAWCLLPFAACMALGRHLLLYGWLFSVFPPLRQTRVPARWIEIFYYGAAILAGVGFDFLVRRRVAGERLERRIGTAFKLLCAAFLILLVAVALTPPNATFWTNIVSDYLKTTANVLGDADELWRSALVEALIGAAFAGGLAFLWQRWREAKNAPQIQHLRLMLLVLVTLDLTGYFWRAAKIAPRAMIQSHATLPAKLTNRYDAQERWDTQVSYMMNHCAARGLDIFTGYDALGAKRFFQFAAQLEGFWNWGALYEPSRRTPLLRVAGVTHTLTSPKTTVPFSSREFPRYKPHLVAAEGQFKLWKWQGAWPRAYLTRDVKMAPEKQQLKLLETLASDEKNSLQPPVVVSPEQNLKIKKTPLSADEGVLKWRHDFNTVTLQTRAAAPSFLVFADTNFPGWTAFINGKETPIETANFLFRGMEVPAAEAKVEMIYQPQSYRLGLFLSLCGLGVLGFCAASFARIRSQNHSKK